MGSLLQFSHSSSKKKLKKQKIIFCICFLPNSSLVGNHAVPLLQVTHGSPMYLNHVDLSSSQLSLAGFFSCTDWNLVIGVTENSSLGECLKLLNEHVWIMRLLAGSLCRCKLPINLLNCLSNSLLQLRQRILLFSVQENLYEFVSLPPQIGIAK